MAFREKVMQYCSLAGIYVVRIELKDNAPYVISADGLVG